MTRRTKIVVDEPCVRPGVTFEMRDGVRHCLSCDAPQHDLTDATEREALQLFAAHGGRLCGKFAAGPGGEIRFRPEPPSRAPQAMRGALLALTLAACDGPETSVTVSPEPATQPPPSALPPPVEPPPDVPTPPVTTGESDPVADTVSSASEQADHATDNSPDPNDHRGHWHRHGGVGVSHHLAGGARAYRPGEAGGLDDL